ncbi:hypothetical protein [Myroides injenensis]|uniref:hypothetical protein n=1 Tax=Myroides injenensis TaxID=1183151 RepID=UPI00028A138E|nr:hypothetical protein [Myroides injenensis]
MENFAVIKKEQKTLQILSCIFSFLAYVLAVVALVVTIYLLFTPRGEGAWILPAFTFIIGLVAFLFLFSFSKIINLLIAVCNK